LPGRRELLAPQDVGQLLAGRRVVALRDEIGEQDPTAAAAEGLLVERAITGREQQLAGEPDPHVHTLAFVCDSGEPHSRTVIDWSQPEWMSPPPARLRSVALRDAARLRPGCGRRGMVPPVM
jgi:hypothetical protein